MDKSKNGNLTSKTRGKTIKANSLCATCNDVAICVFCERANHPVTFCEEFKANDAPQIRLYGTGEISVEKLVDTNKTGLCVNCENVPICVYSKPDYKKTYCLEYA